MQMKRSGLVGVTGILVGLLGVVGPIVWEYYKTKSEIKLRVVGTSTIISKPKKLDGLIITYDGEALDQLSKTVFSLINSGRTPILKKMLPLLLQSNLLKKQTSLTQSLRRCTLQI